MCVCVSVSRSRCAECVGFCGKGAGIDPKGETYHNSQLLLLLLLGPLLLVVVQVTCNVHGVAGVFLDIGRSKAHKPPAGQHRFTKVCPCRHT